MSQCQAADPQFEVGVTEEDDEVGNILQISLGLLHASTLAAFMRHALVSSSLHFVCSFT